MGVGSIFGVPGDFTFGLCDLIEDMPGLSWIGNANELGAAYAADGYSRVNGFGVLLTTWGVGELSALNGVAGAYAERIPLLHIIGSPPTIQAKKRLPIHHSFADGDFGVYKRISEPVSTVMEEISETGQADTIDHVLRCALQDRRPAYLSIPTDMVFREISGAPLLFPLVEQSRGPISPLDEEIARRILTYIEAAQCPVIIADVRVRQYGCSEALSKLLDTLQLPTFDTPLSKGLVDETAPSFMGTYIGASSNPEVASRLGEADLVVRFGYLETDSNTGGFSAKIDPHKLIDLNVKQVQFFDGPEQSVSMMIHILEHLSAHVSRCPISKQAPVFDSRNNIVSNTDSDSMITQPHLWAKISQFLKPNDVVICDTGTASFGVTDIRLPRDSKLLSQMLYNSIGWSVGAAVGAAKALQEQTIGKLPRRLIIIVGDGALQTTVQELSTLLRIRASNVIIIVLNNDGYTIERALHGAFRQYNDIMPWNYSRLLKDFGADQNERNSIVAKTAKDVQCAFDDFTASSTQSIMLLEVYLARCDYPRILSKLGQVSRERNSYGYAPEYNN